jgi:hypothetical protein
MSKPIIHAISSSKKYGGKPEDYEPIHSFIDLSKGAIPTHVHRALTHNSWFCSNIIERIWFPNSCPMTADGRFPYIVNSNNQKISIRDITEGHILEDYDGKFIPTAQDFLENIRPQPWMQNGKNGVPHSCSIYESKETFPEIMTSSREKVYDGSFKSIDGSFKD